MQGRRREDLHQDSDGWSPIMPEAQGGDYWKLVKSNGEVEWYACVPGGFLGNLSAHTITEHEDGTITVSPSILTADGYKNQWHGFLENGVWREV